MNNYDNKRVRELAESFFDKSDLSRKTNFEMGYSFFSKLIKYHFAVTSFMIVLLYIK